MRINAPVNMTRRLRVETVPEDIDRLIGHDNMALFARIINDIIVSSSQFGGISDGEIIWVFELRGIMFIIPCK
jgi:hypothetical protein